MKFKVGETYSRREISNVLGGQMQSYLPTKNGHVVCGCFKPIPEKNPEAPEVVTIRRVDRIEPILASEEKDVIPIFLFRSSAAWEYVGRYRCTGLETKSAVLRKKMNENPDRGPIAGVLYFKRVGN